MLVNQRRYPGFTLIETLIVVLILVILAITVVPSYIYYLQTNRVLGAANSLYYALQNARSESVTRNVPIYVSFQTGTNWCYGINPTTACSCNVPSGCSIGTASSTTATGLTLTATGLSSNAMHFESKHGGAGASSTVTFTLTGKTTAMTIKIGLLGSLQLCSDQISGYQPCS